MGGGEAQDDVVANDEQNSKGVVLVTGGSGYIGSHTCVELLEEGYQVVVIDNLVNSQEEALERVQALTNRKLLAFHKGDLCDERFVDGVFQAHKDITFVIHFAALKAVGESVEKPLLYYENNLMGTIQLLKAMAKYNVKKFVFSSSATVYGEPQQVPISEDFQLQPTNPYGRTKFFIEEVLRDTAKANTDWTVIILRYFNPVGAHPSGRIGENPRGRPNNLLPFVLQVALGNIPQLQVFGNDWPTPDGTGVRDYIHVVDLAKGHTAALRYASSTSSDGSCRTGAFVFNLGTGRGYSVLELVAAIEKASGLRIPFTIVARRPGDVAQCFANPELAKRELQWEAQLGLEEIARDAWLWTANNPKGYQS
eukprot:TRINITY_DN1122_c0_g1_i1.p1 TRINITY_DN1122_c0_g1~~TRINITY_DN1122_c0_g1_i1.p1  ORF type:complete len:366 (+),score=72.60 TRINITY_DN1122_c0_g1_i1:109-1206(+)